MHLHISEAPVLDRGFRVSLVQDFDRGKVVPLFGLRRCKPNLHPTLCLKSGGCLLRRGEAGGPSMAYLGEHCADAVVLIGELLENNYSEGVSLAGRVVDYRIPCLIELGREVEGDDRQVLVDDGIGVDLVPANHDSRKKGVLLRYFSEIESHSIRLLYEMSFILTGVERTPGSVEWTRISLLPLRRKEVRGGTVRVDGFRRPAFPARRKL